jgi:hypothetical protein
LVQGILNETKTKTDEVTTASDSLKNKLVGPDGLVDALGDELEAVRLIVDAYVKDGGLLGVLGDL